MILHILIKKMFDLIKNPYKKIKLKSKNCLYNYILSVKIL